MRRCEPGPKKSSNTYKYATTIFTKLQSFLGIFNYLSKFSTVTAEVCKPLEKLTSVRVDWKWNGMYHDLYNRKKKIVKDINIRHFMMHLDPYTQKLMHQLLVLE